MLIYRIYRNLNIMGRIWSIALKDDMQFQKHNTLKLTPKITAMAYFVQFMKLLFHARTIFLLCHSDL